MKLLKSGITKPCCKFNKEWMLDREKIVAYRDFQDGRIYFVLWFKNEDEAQGRIENFCHFCGAKTEMEDSTESSS